MLKPSVPLSRSGSDAEGRVWSKDSTGARDKPVCFHCRKVGHTVNNYFALNREEGSPKVINLMKTKGSAHSSSHHQHFFNEDNVCKPDLGNYAPFIMKGRVSEGGG